MSPVRLISHAQAGSSRPANTSRPQLAVMLQVAVPTIPLLLTLSPAAYSHALSSQADDESFSYFASDPLTLAVLLLLGACYAWGTHLSRQRLTSSHAGSASRRHTAFWLGWLVLCMALLSPIDSLGEELFAVHMLQHELLIVVAAPLFVFSKPLGTLVWGTPAWLHGALVKGLQHQRVRKLWRFLSSAGLAWLVYAAVLWGWHVPYLFEAALQHYWIHTSQHLSFFLAALVFWWPLFYPRVRNNLVGCLYVFSTTLHSSLLGAALTFSPQVWYPTYLDRTARWGLSPLVDQQLGGLIMWMPAGLVFVAAGLFIVARALTIETLPAISASQPETTNLKSNLP